MSAVVWFVRVLHLRWRFTARNLPYLRAHPGGGACGPDTLFSWWALREIWTCVWQKNTVHSQTVSYQHTGAGDEGGGQSLTSSGSCLKDFRTHPIIECQGARGSCHYFATLYSFWLTTVSSTEQFITPQSGTIKAAEHQRRKASQCHVCFRDQ